MSFILDALKKSEAERLRQDTPGFSDVPGSSKEKSASHWIWIIVVLIGINLTVLVVMFMKPDSAEESITEIPTAEAPENPSSFPEIVAEAKRSQAATAESRPDAPPSAAVATPSPAPRNNAISGGTPVVSESVATFNELRAQGVLTLPDMHLDIHVYSREPADRFVFVNMSKYKENAVLDEGPVVREITPDGVILDYLGTGFLLPRE